MAGQLMRFFLIGAAMAAVTGCAPAVPDSGAGIVDAGRGVGFQNYEDYSAAREVQLRGGSAVTTVPGPIDVQGGVLLDTSEADARARAASSNSGVAPVQASPGNPAPSVVRNSAGISGENDFEAVSGQRDIEADAALIARNRAQYQVIQPTDLPTRDGGSSTNIVEYAVRSTNSVGVPLYKRSGFRSEARSQRACAAYASWDLAQEAFLEMGGPQKDRKGLDPDGDGFACGWNPAPFRAARSG